jgi:hypothetical protein
MKSYFFYLFWNVLHLTGVDSLHELQVDVARFLVVTILLRVDTISTEFAGISRIVIVA